jgi:ribosomal protein L19E
LERERERESKKNSKELRIISHGKTKGSKDQRYEDKLAFIGYWEIH